MAGRGGKVSNRFYVTSIEDGSSISAVLRTDKTLTQVYNPQSHAVIPDWSVAENQPTVFAVVRVNGGIKTSLLKEDWYYNGIKLAFEEVEVEGVIHYYSTIKDGQQPIFEKVTYTMDGNYQVPGLKILTNLAKVDPSVLQTNQDNDTITLEGSVEIGGYPTDFACSITVRISEQSSSGYYGYVDGEGYVTSNIEGEEGYTAYMKAYLMNGTDRLTSFKTVWSREGIDDDPSEQIAGRWPRTVNCDSVAGYASCDIKEPEVTDYVVIRVDYYEVDKAISPENILYTAYWDVDDMQDMEEMYITYGNNNQNNATLRGEGSQVTFKIWMARRTDQTAIDMRYETFQCKLLDSEGKVITQGLQPAPDQYGYMVITQSGHTNPATGTYDESVTYYWGEITISYTLAHNNGDRITGVVTAADAIEDESEPEPEPEPEPESESE